MIKRTGVAVLVDEQLGALVEFAVGGYYVSGDAAPV